MTDTDHTQAIANAARKWVALANTLGNAVRVTDEGRALIAAVEAEEKAREPQLLGAEEADRIYANADGGCVESQVAVLTAAHQRAAAVVDRALANFTKGTWDGTNTYNATRTVVRRALLGKE